MWRQNARYLSSEMAAEYLGLGTGEHGANLIRQLVHRREIPFIKLGSRLRFDRAELDSFMTRRSTAAQFVYALLSGALCHFYL